MRFSYEHRVWHVSRDQGETWKRISRGPSDYLVNTVYLREAFGDSPQENVLENTPTTGTHDQD